MINVRCGVLASAVKLLTTKCLLGPAYQFMMTTVDIMSAARGWMKYYMWSAISDITEIGSRFVRPETEYNRFRGEEMNSMTNCIRGRGHWFKHVLFAWMEWYHGIGKWCSQAQAMGQARKEMSAKRSSSCLERSEVTPYKAQAANVHIRCAMSYIVGPLGTIIVASNLFIFVIPRDRRQYLHMFIYPAWSMIMELLENVWRFGSVFKVRTARAAAYQLNPSQPHLYTGVTGSSCPGTTPHFSC